MLADARLAGTPAESLLDSLREGQAAEIVFQFRLYREQAGLASLFGDRLIREKTVIRQGMLDVFDRRFIVRDDAGGSADYRDPSSFVQGFFSIAGCDLGDPDGDEPGRLYVLARIRYSPVRLVPPLNIVSLFTRRTAVITRWAEAELGGRQ